MMMKTIHGTAANQVENNTQETFQSIKKCIVVEPRNSNDDGSLISKNVSLVREFAKETAQGTKKALVIPASHESRWLALYC